MNNNKEKELETLFEQEQETREAMLSMLEDLQEQKNIFKSSSKEWTNTFDAMSDAIMVHDKNYNIMRANRAYKKLCGEKTYKDIIGKPYFKLFPKLDAPLKTCKEAEITGKMAQEEFLLDDGRVFKSRTYPIYHEDSKLNYGIHIFEDITQEQIQEERLESLNKTLRLISRCNEILVRSESEEELISKVFAEIINQDENDFIGLFAKQESSIFCTNYGFSKYDMPKIKSVDFASSEYKECPVSLCIEENRVITINDIVNDATWNNMGRYSADICPTAPFNMQGSMLLLPIIDEELTGAIFIYSRNKNNFTDETTALFTELANDTAYGIHTLRMRSKLIETSKERDDIFVQIKESLGGTVEAIAKMVEVRDPYTAGHQSRVSHLAVAIAKELGLKDDQIEGIRVAANIHDIGKIQIPAEILSKPTKLTDLEYEMIKTHSGTGYEILKNIHFPWPIAQIVYQHHERIDGNGYPNGLKGDEILLEAKIIAVSDVVEAIASHRPYRAALGIEIALQEIEKGKGEAFDSKVADACLSLFREKNYELPHA